MGGRARRAACAPTDLAPKHKRPHRALGAVVVSIKAGHADELAQLALVAQEAPGQGLAGSLAGMPLDARVDHTEPDSLGVELARQQRALPGRQHGGPPNAARASS
jgi:hypothetical protein